MRGKLTWVAMSLGVLATGCSRTDDFAERFPGNAAILDNLTSKTQANPPVYKDYTLEIVEVDGESVPRYEPPAFEDAYPEALVKAGTHHFLVDSKPIVRPPGFKTKRLEFTGTVEAGKKYRLSDQNGPLELVVQVAR